MADESGTQARPTVAARLLEIQRDLKVEKGQYNSFGKYSYRSKEDILEAAKPLCHERGLLLVCDDEPVDVGAGRNYDGWHYVKATASVIDVESGRSLCAHGYAREPEQKKGMDASQITGTASSYAGKRALGNLFALDDTKDADAMPAQAQAQPPESGPFRAHCQNCGTAYTFNDRAHYEGFAASPGCCPMPDWRVG